jgi:hypothetical protein
MSAANIVAIISAFTALVGAAGGVIALYKHSTGPAHTDPGKDAASLPKLSERYRPDS